MDSTPVSLLQRLRQPAAEDAWARFVDLYTPMLYTLACRVSLQEPDAADLVQDVLTTLVQELPGFDYNRHQSFRAWLRTILLNKWRNSRRRRPGSPIQDAAQVADGNGDPALELAEAEYRQHLAGRALELIQAEFQPTTWKACWEYVVCDRPAADVARELGITINAVYLAKSRVLARLRRELEGLLD
jgi:RNA polymerase sigma-70 factor (ECF subfamily)